jgi:hypothetical protein
VFAVVNGDYITMAGIVKHPLYRTACIRHDYFSYKNMKLHPERFVIVGFIAADGCISDTKTGQKYMILNLAKKDKCILDMINEEICSGGRNLSFNKTTKSLMFYIPSDPICSDLSRWNIVPRKTRKYKLPSNLSKAEMAYFLRGYFYGDGCVYGKKSAKFYALIGTNDLC